jgi:hypothetical protein
VAGCELTDTVAPTTAPLEEPEDGPEGPRSATKKMAAARIAAPPTIQTASGMESHRIPLWGAGCRCGPGFLLRRSLH